MDIKYGPIDGDLYYGVKPIGTRHCGLSTLFQGLNSFKLWIENHSKGNLTIHGQSQIMLHASEYYTIIQELQNTLKKSQTRPDEDYWWLQQWRITPHQNDNLVFFISPYDAKGSVELTFRIYADNLHHTATQTSIILETNEVEMLIKKMLIEYDKHLHIEKIAKIIKDKQS